MAADQTDAGAVREATRGADRLFWVNPPAPPDADPLEHHALAAAAVAPPAWVDPRDIGDVAAARLLVGPGPGRRVQAVHGPADLSFCAAAELLGAALGHPVAAVRITGDEFRAGLRAVGLCPAHVEAVAGMSEGLSDGFVPDDPRDPTTTTPTTLAAWAHTRLRAA